MDSNSSLQRPKLHPLIVAAAVAVILLSVVGIGTMVMERSNAKPSPDYAPAVAQMQTQPQPAQVVDEPQPVAQEKPSYFAPPVAAAAPVSSVPRGDVVPRRPEYRQTAQADVCRNCGVVDSIRDIKVKGEGTGVGAVGGALVGGLLGNMVGAGRGKALATVGGAVAGGFGGNAIEKNVRSEVEHRMVVRLEDGSTRTFTQAKPFPYAVGERVRIVDGHVERG